MIEYKVVKGISASPMERKILKVLRKEGINYWREVEMVGLINPTTNRKLRYDFYFPEHNLILEYDGKEYHQSESVKYRDKIKDEYAKKKRITLVRVTGLNDLSKFFFKHFGIKDKRYNLLLDAEKIVSDVEAKEIDYFVSMSKSNPTLFYETVVALKRSKKHMMYNKLRRYIKPISWYTKTSNLIADKDIIIHNLTYGTELPKTAHKRH